MLIKFISKTIQDLKDKTTQYELYKLQKALEKITTSQWLLTFPDKRYSEENTKVEIVRTVDLTCDELALYINDCRRFMIMTKANKSELLIRMSEIDASCESIDLGMVTVDLLEKLNRSTQYASHYLPFIDDIAITPSTESEVISFYCCLPLKSISFKAVLKEMQKLIEVDMNIGMLISIGYDKMLLNQISLNKEFSVEENN
jgi:hypothetical protein